MLPDKMEKCRSICVGKPTVSQSRSFYLLFNIENMKSIVFATNRFTPSAIDCSIDPSEYVAPLSSVPALRHNRALQATARRLYTPSYRKQNTTMKRSILTILTLATLAISVKAEGVPQQLADLQAQITVLKAMVATLSSQLAQVRKNPVLQLGQFVSVDLKQEEGVMGPNIVFKGANVHIISGSGNTWNNRTSTGLGNLIIGYDEAPSDLVAGERTGCHNLVIGPYNTFETSASGGIVAGASNSISDAGSNVLGGISNFAGGGGTIVGGGQNRVFQFYGTVAGGFKNDSSGFCSTVAGGESNVSAEAETVVVGGINNENGVDGSVVLGGENISNPLGTRNEGADVIGVVHAPYPRPQPAAPATVTRATLN